MAGATVMWRAGLLVSAMAIVLTACGGDGTGDDDGGEPTTSGSPVTTTIDESPATTAPTTTGAPTTSGAPPTTAVPVSAGAQTPDGPASPTSEEFAGFAWDLVVDDAPWEARAGLRVVELDGRLLLLGGRTPKQSDIPGDSTIWADVWASDDGGRTWTDQLPDDDAPWPARAYFQAVVKDGEIYVLGGQDFGLEENPFCALLEQGLEPPPGLGIDPDEPCPEFLPTSTFFNDVWRSTDGVTWEQVTEAAPWEPRAGLSAAVLGGHIYVLAGSQNDDSSIIGPGGPQRIYYHDVWRSADGETWELMTDAAPWEPRAGAAVVVRDDRMFVFGGEDGFTCDPLPDCEAPYFNDVWVTADGSDWQLVTADAGWSPRPGHVCELVGNQFVCFGGFGLVENPTDMWASADGATWTELPVPPWGSDDPAAMRYDFDALVIDDAERGPTILAFGGDRETFDFGDPENYLRVDDDVWSFGSPIGD